MPTFDQRTAVKKARFYHAAGATVKADLIAKTITISGAVLGNVRSSNKVDLRATGSVEGNVIAPRFAMADGAVLRGRVDVSGNRTPATR